MKLIGAMFTTTTTTSHIIKLFYVFIPDKGVDTSYI
jgi:hypothetical protein